MTTETAAGTGFDLDHTSFAVRDGLEWGRRLRSELGAVPIVGEGLAEFRYLVLYVGSTSEGSRIELIEPTGAGFLTRFLDDHGEGPHHITITVPDLRAAVEKARALGLTVVGERYGNPAWQEAFIAPDPVHRTVIQLAESTLAYPAAEELLRTQDRDLSSMPTVEGATDRLWWIPLWDTPRSGAPARMGATLLGSSDLSRSRRLFEDVLGATVREDSGSDVDNGAITFGWPSGAIRVHPSERPGITGIDVVGGPPAGLEIGPVRLGALL